MSKNVSRQPGKWHVTNVQFKLPPALSITQKMEGDGFILMGSHLPDCRTSHPGRWRAVLLLWLLLSVRETLQHNTGYIFRRVRKIANGHC